MFRVAALVRQTDSESRGTLYTRPSCATRLFGQLRTTANCTTQHKLATSADRAEPPATRGGYVNTHTDECVYSPVCLTRPTPERQRRRRFPRRTRTTAADNYFAPCGPRRRSLGSRANRMRIRRDRGRGRQLRAQRQLHVRPAAAPSCVQQNPATTQTSFAAEIGSFLSRAKRRAGHERLLRLRRSLARSVARLAARRRRCMQIARRGSAGGQRTTERNKERTSLMSYHLPAIMRAQQTIGRRRRLRKCFAGRAAYFCAFLPPPPPLTCAPVLRALAARSLICGRRHSTRPSRLN